MLFSLAFEDQPWRIEIEHLPTTTNLDAGPAKTIIAAMKQTKIDEKAKEKELKQ